MKINLFLIDFSAELLGFKHHIPAFAATFNTSVDILTGVNYASGSAGILEETGKHLVLILRYLFLFETIGISFDVIIYNNNFMIYYRILIIIYYYFNNLFTIFFYRFLLVIIVYKILIVIIYVVYFFIIILLRFILTNLLFEKLTIY